MFGKKKKEIIDPDLQLVISTIRYNVSSPSKTYEVTYDEIIAIKAIISHVRNKRKNPRLIRLFRLSNGTLNIFWNSYYVGKIKLQGKDKYLQYMKTLFDPEVIYGETLNDILPYISKLRL